MTSKSAAFGVCLLSLLSISSRWLAAAPTNEFIFIGNSVSYGTDATNVSSPNVLTSNTNAEGVALKDLGAGWLAMDLAVPGSTTSQMIASWNSNNEQSYFVAGVTNKIVIPWEASNALSDYSKADPNGTNTAAQIEANAQTIYNETLAFAQQLQAQGDTVLALTILPRDEPGLNANEAAEQEEARQDFNNLVRAGWQSWASALVDVGADPTIGQYSDLTNGTYWYDPGSGSDQRLHLTDAGYAIVGNDVAAAIQKLDAVPEPSVYGLFLLGGGVLAGWRRLRRTTV